MWPELNTKLHSEKNWKKFDSQMEKISVLGFLTDVLLYMKFWSKEYTVAAIQVFSTLLVISQTLLWQHDKLWFFLGNWEDSHFWALGNGKIFQIRLTKFIDTIILWNVCVVLFSVSSEGLCYKSYLTLLNLRNILCAQQYTVCLHILILWICFSTRKQESRQ